MLAVCSHCQKAIVVDAPGWIECRHCRQKLWVADPQDPDAAPTPLPLTPPMTGPIVPAVQPPSPAADGPVYEIPWEAASGSAPLHRFFGTLGAVLFHSRNTFRELPDTPRTRSLLLYGTLVLTLGIFIYFQVQALSFAVLETAITSGSGVTKPGPWVTEMLQGMKAAKMDSRFFVLSSFLSPLMAWVLLAMSHQLFTAWHYLIHRRRPVPVHRLQRLVSYSYTPWLFIALPLVGLLWFLVVQYRALRQGLELSRASALLLVTVNLLLINLLLQFWITIHALLFRT